MAQEIYHRSEWGNPNEQWGNVYLNADLTNELYKRASEYENSWVTDQLLNGVGTKPSIILTPTAYEDGVLNSVKPVQSLGNELITNGDFSTDSGWSYGSSWSIANGKATATNSTTGSIYQDILDTSKIYKATFEITEITSGSLRIGIGVNFSDYFTSTGVYTYYGQPTTDGLLRINPLSGTNASIDNVSVKEVIDADFDFTRGSSATRVNELGLVQDVQLLSGELIQNGDFEQIGSELVTNGGFDSDTDWTKQTGWSISGGVANYDFTSDAKYIRQTLLSGGFVSGKTYRINFEITSGTAYMYINSNGGSLISLNTYSVGSYSLYTTASANGSDLLIYGRNTSGSAFSIDNVSVKEVGQNWLFQNGWNMGDGVAVYSGTVSAYRTIYQENVLTVSSKYRLTFDIVSIASGSIENISQSSPTSYSTVGTKTEDFIATNTDLFLKPTTDADLTIDNISVVEITDDTDLPRINYTNFDYEDGEVVPYSGEGSLLLEPQSTNLVTYSEDFSQWNANEVTTQTGFLAPDGSNNAIKITSTGSQSYLVLSGLSLTGTDTRTIYARTVSGSGTVNLCSYGQNTNNNFTITPQWQRFEVNGTTTATGEPNFYGVDFRFAEANPLTEVIIWGAQAEALSYATSYIPTNGSTTTRLADVCNNSGSSDLINSTEGVLYAEISSLIDNNDGSKSISISSGAYSNNIIIQYSTNTNQIVFKTSPSYTTPIYQPFTVSNITESSKIAFKYKLDDCSFWHNGVKLGSVTSFTPFSFGTLTVLNFDRGDGNEKFEGKCKCVAVFKEALSDTELQKLTTI
jgi:hypothetical protein